MCVVGAAYAAGVDVNATSARYSGATSTGIRTSVTLEARVTGVVNGVRQYATSVPVSSATLGSLARGAVKRGLGWYGVALAAKDIINGAGWVIDELKQEVQTPSAPATDNPPGTKVGCWKNLGCSATDGGVVGMILSSNDWGYNSCSRSGNASLSPSFWWYECRAPQFEQGAYDNVPADIKILTEWQPDFGTGVKPRTITDQELGEAFKQSPQVINAILIDPETGAPIRTQELTDAMNNLRKQLEAANGIDPGPDATPTPDTSAPQPMESEWPGFCNWAGVVCDFIDWVKNEDTGPEKELPERELEIDPDSWSSGVGEGACPAPQQFAFTVAGHAANGEFSFQPLCDFSTALKPFLILVASIVAVMILAGLRSTTTK
ncbi:virulence factor TspB C-terminal domain-related protein [Xanthomonas campestris pv. raphani]|uniref:virulence factor TspB C-terminal domain-related protein n=1 Tax=Xanthomonas campestris TaxID=339 RepID=UPI00388E9401